MFVSYLCDHCHLVDDVLGDVDVHRNDDDAGHMLNQYNLT